MTLLDHFCSIHGEQHREFIRLTFNTIIKTYHLTDNELIKADVPDGVIDTLLSDIHSENGYWLTFTENGIPFHTLSIEIHRFIGIILFNETKQAMLSRDDLINLHTLEGLCTSLNKEISEEELKTIEEVYKLIAISSLLVTTMQDKNLIAEVFSLIKALSSKSTSIVVLFMMIVGVGKVKEDMERYKYQIDESDLFREFDSLKLDYQLLN